MHTACRHSHDSEGYIIDSAALVGESAGGVEVNVVQMFTFGDMDDKPMFESSDFCQTIYSA